MKAGGEQKGIKIVCSTWRCPWKSTNPFEGAVHELCVLSLLSWAHKAQSRAGDTTAHTTATNPPCPLLLRTAEQKQFLTWRGFWREERATVQVRTCSLKVDLGQTGLHILFWLSRMLSADSSSPISREDTTHRDPTPFNELCNPLGHKVVWNKSNNAQLVKDFFK